MIYLWDDKLRFFGKLIFLFFILSYTLPAEPPNPQFILEAWDKEVSAPDGMQEWKLKEEPPGLSETDLVLYSDKNTRKLIIQKNLSGDPIAKFLLQKEEDLFLLSKKNSSVLEKLNLESTLAHILRGTSLTLFDLVGFSLEKNFLVRGIQAYSGKEKQYWKLDLKPLFKGLSGVVLYSEKDSLKPYRLDFISENGSLERIVRVYFGAVEIQNKGKKETGTYLNRIESTNMNSGKKSEISFHKLVVYPPVPPSAFQRNALDF